MKKSYAVLSILAMAALLVGCNTKGGNKSSSGSQTSESGSGDGSGSEYSGDSSSGGSSSSESGSGDSSSDSSSSEEQLAQIDKDIKAFLSGYNVTYPAVGEMNLEYDVIYYYSYGLYVFRAECEDAAGTMADAYNARFATESNLVVYNDEDYTVEEYGYMYADDFDNANFEMDFLSEEGYFDLRIIRYDGAAGSLDVSGVDTSWYVDFINFEGYTFGNSFPAAQIKDAFQVEVPLLGPTGTEFVYAFIPAHNDEYGDFIPDTFNVCVGGDVTTSYASALTTAGYVVESETQETIDWEAWEIIEYTEYIAHDTEYNYLFTFSCLPGAEYTVISINYGPDIYSFELTEYTDWKNEEKELMNTYLGQLLPFMKFGDDFVFEYYPEDDYDYAHILINDNYYQDLTEDYIALLLADGFVVDSTTYDSTCYVYDNHTAYIEIFVGYQQGNYVIAYFEPTRYIPATSITLDVHELEIVAGASYQLNATMEPEDAESAYEFTSDDENIATVTGGGLVSISPLANAGDEVNITVTTSEGIEDTCKFTVANNAVTGLNLNATSLKLAPGQSFELQVVNTLPFGATLDPAYPGYGKSDTPANDKVSISDAGVISVSEDAVVGSTAQLYVTYGPLESQRVLVNLEVVHATVTDTLDQDAFSLDGTTTYKDYTATGASGVSYKAQCSNGNSSIQIRSKNSNSGIVGGDANHVCKSISITFNSATEAGRQIDIYAANEEFEISDMYGKTMTKISSVSYNGTQTTVTYEFEADYSFIGIRSNSGALYISSIDVVWQQK